ncbi:hypothetical protein [Brucella pseudogrignonensis]|uniref:hypothetical protein n=1 Tax=Brucella pseudogrignonensis TaxID=419475 RepID=UPI003D974338
MNSLDEVNVNSLKVDAPEGIDIISFNDVNPKCAIISFSSMNVGQFERWTWFWKKRLSVPCVYIFLKDDEQHYYLGTESDDLTGVRERIISKILEKHGVPKCAAVTIGSSMGGYASIYFAHQLNLKCAISINPQVDLESAAFHTYSLWQRKMKEVGRNWKDLDKFICNKKSKPLIYLVNGEYTPDKLAADKIDSAFRIQGHIVIRERYESEEHGWVGMNSDRLFDVVNKLLQEPRNLTSWSDIEKYIPLSLPG